MTARRVLCVRLSAMGDVMHALPALRELRSARPDWQITMAVQAEIAPLLAGIDGLDVVEHRRSRGLRGLWQTARRLRARQFDLALDFQGNWKAAALARLARVPERLGIERAARREPSSARLLTREVPLRDRRWTNHPAHQAMALVEAALSLDAVAAAPLPDPMGSDAEAQPELRPRDEERVAEAAALRTLGVDPDRPFAVLVWTDPGDNRAWRPGSMARCAAALAIPTVWLAGPAEHRLVAPPGVRVLRHGPGEVRRLVALGAIVRAGGGVVLGPDQGATHVLAASGAPTRALFGPQDPALTAPPRAEIATVPEPPACMPCRDRNCRHADGPICMAFEPATVLSADGPVR